MTAPTAPELAARALALLDGDGWASVLHDRSASVVLARGGRPRTLTVDRREVTLTAWRDGHVASVRTSATDDAGLDSAARAAVRTAERAAAEADAPGDATPPPEPVALRAHDAFDLATAAADPAAGLQAAREALAVAADHRPDAPPVAVRWHGGGVRHALAASTGLAMSDHTTDAHLRVRVGAGGVFAATATASARAAGDLDATTLTRTALARIPVGDWRDPTPGEQTMVLGPEAVAAVLEVAGTLIFDGLAAADGRTRIAARLGTRVASSNVNLSDTPRFPRTLPHAYDGSGVPHTPIPLIQDGVLHRLVHDGRARASTGHATDPGGGAHGPRPANLVLVGGGAADVDELVAGVDVGLLIWALNDVRPINAELGLAAGIAVDGAARIADGRVDGAAGSVPVLVAPLAVLEGAAALTSASTLVGRPTRNGRRFGHGTVAPALRTSGGVLVTG